MENQVSCKVCGRPLKATTSVARGMGPKCAETLLPPSQRKGYIAQKPEYKFLVKGDYLIILPTEKTDDGPSLTNSMDAILYQLQYEHKMNIFSKRIIYKDSEGFFDAVIPSDPGHNLTEMFYFKFAFAPLRVKSEDLAMAGYDYMLSKLK